MTAVIRSDYLATLHWNSHFRVQNVRPGGTKFGESCPTLHILANLPVGCRSLLPDKMRQDLPLSSMAG